MKYSLWTLCAAVVFILGGCGDDVRTITATPAPTGTAPVDATATVGVTEGRPPTETATPVEPLATETATPVDTVASETATPVITMSVPTATPLQPTMIPSATPAGTATGPEITHFGITTADDRPIASSGTDAEGRLIYRRELGSGLNIVVEGAPGSDLRPLGREAFNQAGLPDLQLLVSRPLGDGSLEVCDVQIDGPNGGVPATDPPVFSDSRATVDAINDLGCRVNNGAGEAVLRAPSGQACTRFESGDFTFVNEVSSGQFCLPIALAWAFPQGDTIVSARLRSSSGSLGRPQQIVVRILGGPIPTVPTTPTRTPIPPVITYFGVASADDSVVQPVETDAAGRSVFSRLIGHGMSLIIEATAGPGGLPVGNDAFSAIDELPSLQVLVSRDLGDGAPAVCDVDPDNQIFGGVPGIDPLLFSMNGAVVDAINDLGCRVNDGTGEALGRDISTPCTRDDFGNFAFVDPSTTIQFCLPIARAWRFAPGETTVAARVRSVNGGTSVPEELVVRVAGDDSEGCQPGGPGLRTFSINRASSSFEVEPLGGDGSTEWSADLINLCAEPSENDVYPLRLLEDATLGFGIVDGSVLCMRLAAEGSGGILDCAGLVSHDMLSRIDVENSGGVLEHTSGLGLPSGTGSASIALQVSFRTLPIGSSIADCDTARFGSFARLGLTTGVATAEVTNTEGMFDLSIAGSNFDCDRWTVEDSRGTLVMPLASELPTELGGTANVFVLDD